MNYKVSHPTKVVDCEIDLPSSKSISNRLLIIKSLCQEEFQIQNLANSDDTIILQQALTCDNNTIDVGHAGTTFRFLTSYLSTREGKKFILTGSKRIKKRPIKELVNQLRNLGANIEYLEQDGVPPLEISGKELKGGEITIDATKSSQFISALLMVAPILKNGLTINLEGEIVSRTYIEMTLKLIQEYGISYSWIGNVIEIKQQKYIAKNHTVESDWSAATFWFQIASLSGSCKIKLNGLSENSLQGDVKAIQIFKNLGVSSVFENNTLILTKNNHFNFPTHINLLDTPDLYQSLRCTLFALGLNPKIIGLKTLKDKETNRIMAVENELQKLNTTKIIETYKDHRMAMSFAPSCLKFGKLKIQDIEVVSKSYPNFWKDLQKAGFTTIFSTD